MHIRRPFGWSNKQFLFVLILGFGSGLYVWYPHFKAIARQEREKLKELKEAEENKENI